MKKENVFLAAWLAFCFTLASVVPAPAQVQGGVLGGNKAITGTTISATTAFRAADGSAATPSYGFTNSTDMGLYRRNSGYLGVSVGGAESLGVTTSSITLRSTQTFGWSSTTDPGAGADTMLVRDAANTVALKNANNPQTLNQYAGNGGFMSVVAFNESLTIAAAATTDSATTIPAGAQIIAAAVRVTTVIPTAATFTVTLATGGTALNTAAVSTAANSTDAGTAGGGATYTSAGTKIRITPNLTPGAATGVVRINGYYRIVTPPTS